MCRLRTAGCGEVDRAETTQTFRQSTIQLRKQCQTFVELNNVVCVKHFAENPRRFVKVAINLVMTSADKVYVVVHAIYAGKTRIAVVSAAKVCAVWVLRL